MQELSNRGYDGRVAMNWEIHEKNSRCWTIELRSSRSIVRSCKISHETNEASEIQTYVKFKSYEIHGTFYPPYLPPFPTRFFGKRLGFNDYGMHVNGTWIL